MASRKEQDRAIAARVQSIVEPLCARMGYELVLVEYGREPSGMVLRLFVDKPGQGSAPSGGITLDDCTALSREVSALLDVEDPVEAHYHLEVSSPGVNRPLVRERDFVRYAGQDAKIVTHEVLEGRRTFQGVLRGFEDGQVVIEVDGRSYHIPMGSISRANLVFRF